MPNGSLATQTKQYKKLTDEGMDEFAARRAVAKSRMEKRGAKWGAQRQELMNLRRAAEGKSKKSAAYKAYAKAKADWDAARAGRAREVSAATELRLSGRAQSGIKGMRARAKERGVELFTGDDYTPVKGNIKSYAKNWNASKTMTDKRSGISDIGRWGGKRKKK